MKSIVEASASFPEAVFAPGEVLIHEGQRSPSLFVLRTGTVHIMRGAIKVNETKAPGSIFGEMSVLLAMPASASVVAGTKVIANRIKDGEAFLATDPDVAFRTAQLLAQRLYDATTYLADIKRQYEDDRSHLGMVDRILGSLLNQQIDSRDKRPADRRGSLIRCRAAAKIAGQHPALCHHRLDGKAQAIAVFGHLPHAVLLAQPFQHHRGGQDHRHGVGHALSGNVWRRAVAGLKDRMFQSDIC